MKKILPLIFLISGIFTSFGQDLDGVWITIDNLNSTSSSSKNRLASGTLLSFANNSISSLYSDKTYSITVNRKQTKIKGLGIKGKLKVKKQNENELLLIGAKNKSYVFRKLDLSHKIDMNEKELASFLVNQQCDPIMGIKGQFTKEQFYLDKKADKPHLRNQFINYDERSNGYWFFKKTNGIVFFVLSTGKNKSENILQITSVSLKGLELSPVKEANPLKKFTLLKTCL